MQILRIYFNFVYEVHQNCVSLCDGEALLIISLARPVITEEGCFQKELMEGRINSFKMGGSTFQWIGKVLHDRGSDFCLPSFLHEWVCLSLLLLLQTVGMMIMMSLPPSAGIRYQLLLPSSMGWISLTLKNKDFSIGFGMLRHLALWAEQPQEFLTLQHADGHC